MHKNGIVWVDRKEKPSPQVTIIAHVDIARACAITNSFPTFEMNHPDVAISLNHTAFVDYVEVVFTLYGNGYAIRCAEGGVRALIDGSLVL